MTNFLLLMILLAIPGGAAILSSLVGAAALAIVFVVIVALIVVAVLALIFYPEILIYAWVFASIWIVVFLVVKGFQSGKAIIKAKFGAEIWDAIVRFVKIMLVSAVITGLLLMLVMNGALNMIVALCVMVGTLAAIFGLIVVIEHILNRRSKSTTGQ